MWNKSNLIKNKIMTLIIILAIVAALVLWFISAQRELVNQDELCKNALSQIGVQQASRWDALKALVELTKSYSEHEYNTLRDIIAMRKNVTGSSTAADVEEQEKALSSAMRQINIVAEQYPDLKANDTYIKTMDSVNTYENQVRMSRMVYNDTVTKYNRLIRQIPSNFAASMLHFTERQYLEVAAEKTEMPSMKI